MIDTWIDAEQIERDALVKRNEAGKLAAIDHAAADYFDSIDKANHFRQRWATVTRRRR